MITLALHPIVELFPKMTPDEFGALVADIKANGVKLPALVHQGLIIDGRHRWLACKQLGIECPSQKWDGKDIWLDAQSLNLVRRHTPADQVAAIRLRAARAHPEIAAPIEKARADAKESRAAHQGRPNKTGGHVSPSIPKSGKSRDKIGSQIGVSGSTIQRVETVARKSPEKLAEIADGTKTATQAIREIKESERETKRAANRALIDAAPKLESAIEKGARFSTIVIDPPWDWGDEGDADQLGRARPTYGTMTIDQLLELPVAKLADKDCHLYLWITNRSLPKGFALLERWGFRFVTVLTWCKPSIGMGNYFRGSTEHLLFGVRGSLPLNRKDAGTWFAAPRGKEHSAKPAELYRIVESCSPGPYLEMFSRSPRKNWTAWGAES